MYDFRARERRRQIEEQEALAAQLLRQVVSISFSVLIGVTSALMSIPSPTFTTDAANGNRWEVFPSMLHSSYSLLTI